jgi:hypothetical protein
MHIWQIIDKDWCAHYMPFYTVKNAIYVPEGHFPLPKLITWLYIDSKSIKMVDSSDDNVDLDTRFVARQALVLEMNYKEMIIQGDEVDLRIKLWRDAIEICKRNSNSIFFHPSNKH